jgi:hypothetical protein
MHHDDLVNVNPLLGPFQDLGGNVADLDGDGIVDGMMGYQLKKGSFAFDRVDPSTGDDPRDQRGFLRAQDQSGAGSGWNDIGAVEKGPWEAERISQYQLSGGTHTLEPSAGPDPVNLSDGRAMRFRATANNQFVTYRIPIAQTGSYAIEVKARKGSSGAQARLQWSPNGSTGWTNLGGVQEFYATTTSEVHLDFTATLSPVGQIYFRWLVTGKNTASSNRDVITDFIRLTKQ